jgi:hypothetical protein
MSDSGTSWGSRLAAPALAALMVACCLAAPLIVGAGALTAGALFGLGAAALVLVGVCLVVARRRRDKRCC